MKKGNGPRGPERYWRKYNDHIQKGLKVLAILDILPDVEYPKPNKATRKFLTQVEERFGGKDLGIKKQVVMPIMNVIEHGLSCAKDEKTRAKWFMKITKNLGIEMSMGAAVDILRGFVAMNEFLVGQVNRKFKPFFPPEKTKEQETEPTQEPEEEPEIDDLDEPEEEEETMEPVPTATGETEKETEG